MPYLIQAYSDVEIDLKAIPEPTRGRVRRAINSLGDNPRPVGYIKMAGFRNAYRIRVGNYRIGYQVFDQKLIVTVVAAAERGKVYQIMKRRLKK